MPITAVSKVLSDRLCEYVHLCSPDDESMTNFDLVPLIEGADTLRKHGHEEAAGKFFGCVARFYEEWPYSGPEQSEKFRRYFGLSDSQQFRDFSKN